MPYCILCHVKRVAHSDVLKQSDETKNVVLLKQCWILISNLPGGFVFSQKEELPPIYKFYQLNFFFRKMNQRIRLLIFRFLTLFMNESLIMSTVSDCTYLEGICHL